MTKSTEEMSKELYDWLKRVKDKTWHRRDENNICSCGVHPNAKYKEIYCRRDEENMDFFSPATEDQAAVNFFWLWDRAIANEATRFFLSGELSIYTVSCKILGEALYEFKEGQK